MFALPQPDISAIAARAQALGFWIRVAQDGEVFYLHGNQPCTTCRPEEEASFFDFPQLYLDDGLFWTRIDAPEYRLNLRPSAELLGFYEVTLLPKMELSLAQAEEIACGWLEQLAITPGSSLSFTLQRIPEKPRPPEGVRLDSVLYALALAPDWADFAASRGLDLLGMRIKVVVELQVPGAQLGDYHQIEEARTDDLIRVLIPVSELLRLAQDPVVKFVRLPYQPQPAG